VKVNEITEAVIGAAIEVHRALGPGLLESDRAGAPYVQCLCYELTLRKMPFELELPLPVVYKGLKLDCGYRVDIVVVGAVVVEVKAIERLVSRASSSTPHVPALGRLEGWSSNPL
jgi:GxxExxY protein